MLRAYAKSEEYAGHSTHSIFLLSSVSDTSASDASWGRCVI